MKRTKEGHRVLAVVACGLLGCLAAAGCQRGAAGISAGRSEHAAGQAVFAANCAQCHTIGGSALAGGPGERLRGPDLSHVGADPEHTRQWFLDRIRDPQAENPRARMPKFAGKIKEGDLLALADYLASLKGS